MSAHGFLRRHARQRRHRSRRSRVRPQRAGYRFRRPAGLVLGDQRVGRRSPSCESSAAAWPATVVVAQCGSRRIAPGGLVGQDYRVRGIAMNRAQTARIARPTPCRRSPPRAEAPTPLSARRSQAAPPRHHGPDRDAPPGRRRFRPCLIAFLRERHVVGGRSSRRRAHIDALARPRAHRIFRTTRYNCTSSHFLRGIELLPRASAQRCAQVVTRSSSIPMPPR